MSSVPPAAVHEMVPLAPSSAEGHFVIRSGAAATSATDSSSNTPANTSPLIPPPSVTSPPPIGIVVSAVPPTTEPQEGQFSWAPTKGSLALPVARPLSQTPPSVGDSPQRDTLAVRGRLGPGGAVEYSTSGQKHENGAGAGGSTSFHQDSSEVGSVDLLEEQDGPGPYGLMDPGSVSMLVTPAEPPIAPTAAAAATTQTLPKSQTLAATPVPSSRARVPSPVVKDGAGGGSGLVKRLRSGKASSGDEDPQASPDAESDFDAAVGGGGRRGEKKPRCSCPASCGGYNFTKVFVILTACQVVVTCVVIWLVGYLSLISATDTLSHQVREAIMTGVLSEVNSQLALPISAAQSAHYLARTRFRQIDDLTTIRDQDGFLADLYDLGLRFPTMARIGFFNRYNVYAAIQRSTNGTQFSSLDGMYVTLNDLTQNSTIDTYQPSPIPSRNLVLTEEPLLLNPEIYGTDSAEFINDYLGEPIYSGAYNMSGLTIYKAVIASIANSTLRQTQENLTTLESGWTSPYTAVDRGADDGSLNFLSMAAWTPSVELVSGNFTMCGFALYKLTQLESTLSKMPFGTHGQVHLVRAAGDILASSDSVIQDYIADMQTPYPLLSTDSELLQKVRTALRRWGLIVSASASLSLASSSLITVPYQSTSFVTTFSADGSGWQLNANMLDPTISALPFTVVLLTKDSDYDGNVQTVIRTTIIVAVCACVVAMLIAFGITRCLTRPLLAVVDYMDKAVGVISMDRGVPQREALGDLCENWSAESGMIMPPLLNSSQSHGALATRVDPFANTPLYASFCWLCNDAGDTCCLAVGTKVATIGDDGKETVASVEEIKVGSHLLGQHAEPIDVTHVVHGSRDTMYEVRYTRGTHTVTPNHPVTLRWSTNPRVQLARHEGIARLTWTERRTQEMRTTSWRYGVNGMTATPTIAAPLLPHDMSDDDVCSFAHSWLRAQELAGLASPLRSGDLFEVGAEKLSALLLERASFAQHVAVPMVELVARDTTKMVEIDQAGDEIPTHQEEASPLHDDTDSAASLLDAHDLHDVRLAAFVKNLQEARSATELETRAARTSGEVVYLLERPSSNEQGARARRHLEEAWREWSLNATQLRTTVVEVDHLADTASESMDAVLASRPNTVIVFGEDARERWLASFEHLSSVERGWTMTSTDGDVSILIQLRNGCLTRVLFAGELVAAHQFESILIAVARAHHVAEASLAEASRRASRHSSALTSVSAVRGCAYVALTVSSRERRFVLADGAVTHNCCFRVGRSLREVQSMHRAFGSMLYTLASYDELEAINQAKRQFIRYIFHEVRVPFNAIVMGIEQMQLELAPHQLTFGTTIETLGILLEQSAVVSRILNDVLSMQKIEDGALALEYDTFSLEKMIRGALYAFRTPCLEKRLKVRVNLQNLDDLVNEALPGLRLGKLRVRHSSGGAGVSSAASGGIVNGGARLLNTDTATGNLAPRSGVSGGGVGSGTGVGQFQAASTISNTLGSDVSSGPSSETYHAQVRGDPYRLRQCLANFVSNAIKFTPIGGMVRVSLDVSRFEVNPLASIASDQLLVAMGLDPKHKSASRSNHKSQQASQRSQRSQRSQGRRGHTTHPSWHQLPVSQLVAKSPPVDENLRPIVPELLGTVMVRVSVRDTGAGVPPEHVVHLFEAYRQVQAGKIQKGNGTGLGLNISKSIVELHGGQIGYMPAVPEGSEFYFVLPMDVMLVRTGSKGDSSSYGPNTSTPARSDRSQQSDKKLEPIAGSPEQLKRELVTIDGHAEPAPTRPDTPNQPPPAQTQSTSNRRATFSDELERHGIVPATDGTTLVDQPGPIQVSMQQAEGEIRVIFHDDESASLAPDGSSPSESQSTITPHSTQVAPGSSQPAHGSPLLRTGSLGSSSSSSNGGGADVGSFYGTSGTSSQSRNRSSRGLRGANLGVAIPSSASNTLHASAQNLMASVAKSTSSTASTGVSAPSVSAAATSAASSRTSAGSQGSPNSLAGCRCLVVEDSAPNRKLLMQLLRHMGCISTGVENGKECVDLFQEVMTTSPSSKTQHVMPVGAVTPTSIVVTTVPTSIGASANRMDLTSDAAAAIISQYPFDVILMDGSMPVMNGVEATQILRQHGVLLPIIAVTGNALAEDVSAFMSAGCNAVLTKPINRKKLQEVLNIYAPPQRIRESADEE